MMTPAATRKSPGLLGQACQGCRESSSRAYPGAYLGNRSKYDRAMTESKATPRVITISFESDDQTYAELVFALKKELTKEPRGRPYSGVMYADVR